MITPGHTWLTAAAPLQLQTGASGALLRLEQSAFVSRVVRVDDITPDEDGRCDGFVQEYEAEDNTWDDGAECYVVGVNGEALQERYYTGLLVGQFEGYEVYAVQECCGSDCPCDTELCDNGYAVVDDANEVTVSGLNCPAGFHCTLLTVAYFDSGNEAIDSVHFTGGPFIDEPMTEIINVKDDANDFGLAMYYLPVTGEIVNGEAYFRIIPGTRYAASCMIVDGLSSVLASASDSGTGTDADSGAIAAGGSFVWGAVATLGPASDTEGSWGGSFTALHFAGTDAGDDVCVRVGYIIGTGTNAVVTGMTSRDWICGVASLE